MHATLAGVILWCWFLRSFVFAGVGPDDAEQLIFSQSFDLGYSTGNPPLITCLVILFQQIFGKKPIQNRQKEPYEAYKSLLHLIEP